jgi:serine phosphatase RsbU (regulator of sigma subunit)
VLGKTRELVLETFSKSDSNVKDGMDISLVSINKKTLEVKWAGAYNPLWYISDGNIMELKADKQSIGRTDDPKPFTTHTLSLSKGDWLFLFTDGFADQFGGVKGKKFKYKPLQELLLKNSKLPPAAQYQALDETFTSWKGDLEQVDDICVIGIQL